MHLRYEESLRVLWKDSCPSNTDNETNTFILPTLKYCVALFRDVCIDARRLFIYNPSDLMGNQNWQVQHFSTFL
jgi:hypothetical protein